MIFLATIAEALAAIDRFLILHAALLPDEHKTALLNAGAKVSAIDKMVEVAEILYAARSELEGEALAIAAQVAEFCARYGWHGLADEGRGAGMVDAFRRQLGEPHPTGGEWPDPASDPAPRGSATPPPAEGQ